MSNAASHHKYLYRLVLNSFDDRLKTTKIQLCAALLDPFLANNKELFEEIQNRYTDTSRADLISYFVAKYKLADDDTDNISVLSENQARSRPNTSASSRQKLLGNFVATNNNDNENRTSQAHRTLSMQTEDYFEAAKSADLNIEVTNWWSMNEKKFPAIARLARLALAIPATSAAAESAFSIGSCVITAKRNRISPFTASQVLFVHDNFDKMQQFELTRN